MPPTDRGGWLWGLNSSLPIYITIPQKGDKKRADFSTLTTDIPLGNKLRNSHRDLLPNIDTAYFCNIGMENPWKHWVFKGSVGGEDGIRTHVRLLANWFRVLSPSVNYMFSPVSFSQPCTPTNPHEIWTFWKNRPEIRRNRSSVPISDFSAFGKNCGKNGKNKNQ